MEQLIIDANNETPSINFDGEKGVFSIIVKSYPEDVSVFYNQAFEYINLYKQYPQEKTIIEFNWLYYNTATSN